MSPPAGPEGHEGHEGEGPEGLEGHEGLDEMEDDPSLKAMRSVWLSMRDEEPGTGGLSALMAAAHAKAAEMRPPSLWARFAAAMRRPPALAFATVLVLVGGAVVVSQQAKDEPVAMERAAGSSETARQGDVQSTAPAAAAPAAPAPAVPAAAAADMPAAAAQPVAPPTSAFAAPEPPPSHRSATDDYVTSKAKKPARKADEASSSKPRAPGSADQALEENGTFDKAQDSLGGVAAGAAAPGRVAPAPAPAPPPPPTPASNDTSAAADSAPPPSPAPVATKAASNASGGKAAPAAELSALEHKASAAADAGDCGTVEQLMSIIGKRDPQARARLARQPSIQGCLARTKAPAADVDR